MILLTLVLCALNSGSACVERVMPTPFESPLGCMVAGQEQAAAWLAEHPGYRLDGWRCGREERRL